MFKQENVGIKLRFIIKSGFKSREGYNGACTVVIVNNMIWHAGEKLSIHRSRRGTFNELWVIWFGGGKAHFRKCCSSTDSKMAENRCLANTNAFYVKQIWRISEIALASPKPDKS